jgi:hypothetical protein
MTKSNEMMRREIPNRITQPTVQALKVRVIIFARKLKEKNNVGQLDQIGVKLDSSTGYRSETNFPVSPIVHQVCDWLREPGGFWVNVAVTFVNHE